MNYLGRPLSEFTLQQLQAQLAYFETLLAQRDEASKHDKFNKTVGNKKAMPFPTVNTNFMVLKAAIEEEIKKR